MFPSENLDLEIPFEFHFREFPGIYLILKLNTFLCPYFSLFNLKENAIPSTNLSSVCVVLEFPSWYIKKLYILLVFLSNLFENLILGYIKSGFF